MAQSEQPKENTTQFDRKSGKGLRDGVVSELFTIWLLHARPAGPALARRPRHVMTGAFSHR